jgi:ADP-ribose pyrophosphatase YjhB (NUDIX family)
MGARYRRTVAGESRRLVGLLAEPDRLRVVAALALGAATPAEVAQAAGLPPRAVAAALRRLESGGLVSTVAGVLRLADRQFAEAARAETVPRPVEDYGVSDPAAAAVLRAFVRDGRLTQIPVARAKRRTVLEHIASTFEPGMRYPERQVDAMLRAWYPDYASLRRYLVDEQLLARDAGVYWRSGGWVDVLATPPRREQRVAAYGLAEAQDEDAVLLTRLARGVHRGLWTLPGGGLSFGERPADAVVRETREETGLDVRVAELLDVDAERLVFERDGQRVDGHPVRILYRVEVLGGTLGVSEVDGSTADAAWWRRDAVDPAALTPYAAAALRTGRLR